MQECLPAGVHPRQGRLCGGSPVSPALCHSYQPEGHELVGMALVSPPCMVF